MIIMNKLLFDSLIFGLASIFLIPFIMLFIIYGLFSVQSLFFQVFAVVLLLFILLFEIMFLNIFVDSIREVQSNRNYAEGVNNE